MTDKLKKQLILNLPYLVFVYLFDKLCQGVRLAPGADASEKLPSIRERLAQAQEQAKTQHRQREKVKTKDREVAR